MQTVPVTLKRCLAIWWLWMWRTIVITMTFSFVLGLGIGFFGAMLGFAKEELLAFANPVVMLGTVLIGIMVFGSIFRKRFKNFRVVILPDTRTATPEEGITFARTFKAWWLVSWRGMVPALLAGAAIGFLAETLQKALSFNPAFVLYGVPLLAMAVGLRIGLWAIQSMFRKKFKDFRILMVAPFEERIPAPPAPPASKRLQPRTAQQGHDIIADHLGRREEN